LKILSTEQIRQADSFTIRNEPIPSIDLMERACRAFVQWFISRVDATNKIGVVCGTGNNGGDGMGIARMLREWGYDVKVWVVKGTAAGSDDFRMNLQRLQGKCEIVEITTEKDRGLFGEVHVLIDALFGSGLSRPAEGIYAQVIRCINSTDVLKIAVDIPSGLMADKHSEGEIVKADYTVSFQVPKLAFFLPDCHTYTGEWTLVDIGLQKKFIRETETSYHFIQRKDACRILKPRGRFDHKGTFGHALLIAGSYGKMGAAVLSVNAALRSGPGLVTVHTPATGFAVIQSTCPEAMYSADANERIITGFPDVSKFSCIGIGPGLGQADATGGMLEKLFDSFTRPCVIDADALNLIATNENLKRKIPAGSILTPHPKEFERLVGKWKNDFERLEKQKVLASTLNAVVVVKGAYTTTALPSGKVLFNSTGNPGMATGGTGDVLTGILTGLLAQSYSSEETAILGVYLHGLAGDLAAIEVGEDSLLPRDIIESLPWAFKKAKAK
jgi:ADP-dependent NAD(P)H-hydrate dehydratase / NAD(P)H-hydrate epimerase